ncbi:HTH domain-containing protein [Staphylococcus gallinarum]|jgi:DNA-binding MarR family transcriptional regulator|uniref:winged helix DNA-binding protein n=1 Tax=Staphylococcus TaxID=1279 RepID=UPI000D1EF76C|nr:winged helix DNA-binding protein [Staphylococcus gallinarum]MCD8820567.1 winged helix DNA-binding protein [Staphylococcus gallinarum]PTK91184.1 transcriptional regulator [Staphylococcus gallinarum]PTL09838.1 transcriptional regulator [Staphylococcus gallinarum]PTL12311.1 transcriptional regulator [Staphylococcus gallinarum]RIL35129.1 HTH domain-containing protein [Staphylococcus gallinarum]
MNQHKRSTNTDLINLISDRHNEVRQKVEYLTTQQLSKIHFSSSEWYLITIIQYGSPSLAELTRTINLTRQAIHKVVKQLQQKAVVQIEAVPNNKKEKRVTLTPLGVTYYEQYIANKERLIMHIGKVIGISELAQLQDLLQQDWQLQSFDTE